MIRLKIEDFNCGGFALKTYDLYLPYEDKTKDFAIYFDDKIEELYYSGLSLKEIENEILEETVEYMLKNFPKKLRVIKNFSDLKDTEELIAYRIGLEIFSNEDEIGKYYTGCDGDFHFKVLRDGHWLEKFGEGLVIFEEFTTEPWKCNGMVYDSPIVFLGLRK